MTFHSPPSQAITSPPHFPWHKQDGWRQSVDKTIVLAAQMFWVKFYIIPGRIDHYVEFVFKDSLQATEKTTRK
jgi:hypothetical protein